MKKMIVMMAAVAAMALVAFTTPKNAGTGADPSVASVASAAVKTVSVCKITGSGVVAANCNFSGKYDSENNYITIYTSKGESVASGRPAANRNTTGKRANYTHCLNNTYFFNL